MYSHASKWRVKANSDSMNAPRTKAMMLTQRVNTAVSPGWTRRHSCAGCYGRTISPPGSDGKGLDVQVHAVYRSREAKQGIQEVQADWGDAPSVVPAIAKALVPEPGHAVAGARDLAERYPDLER